MKPLIDFDVLRYEVGFGCEYKDEDGESRIRGFDSVISSIEEKLKWIQEEAWADEEPTLYITGDEKLRIKLNKRRKKDGLEELPPAPNFREALAVTQPYKERHGKKPFHFSNITSYILANYDVKIAWGMEADDLISIDHLKNPNSIICTRDKDLRITPGNHYGWSCGKQLSFGPMEIDDLGFIDLKGSKFKGGGLKFFYSQMLTGDSVDTIPGIRGKGPAFAYKLLNDLSTEEELHNAVASVYEQYKGDEWRTYFREQANLLWMVRELDEEGQPVLFKMYDER